MGKKKEIEIVHPRAAHDAIGGFIIDCWALLNAASEAHKFMTDDSLDAEKVREVMAPRLKEAIEAMQKWREA